MSEEESDDSVLPHESEELTAKKYKYKITKLLGKGGYGAVYEVVRLTDNQQFAIKCEKTTAIKKTIMLDCDVMRGAQTIKSKHFCWVLDRASVKDRFNFIVMKLVGKNLWDLRVERDDNRFTLNTSLKAAEQCLVAIEQLHRFGYLHRDIKPGNFAIGRKEAKEHHIVFMLDFGLCRQFCKKSEQKDIRVQRNVAPFRGTTRYAPLSAMLEKDQCRKDDLEGWLYMVVEWTSGGLPWRKLKASDYDQVLTFKQELRTCPEILEDFLYQCPKREFTRILKYIDQLDYFCIPDYEFIYYCLLHAEKANNIKDTDPIDWDMENPYSGPKETPGDGTQIEYQKNVEEFGDAMALSGTTAKSKEQANKKSKKKNTTLSSHEEEKKKTSAELEKEKEKEKEKDKEKEKKPPTPATPTSKIQKLKA